MKRYYYSLFDIENSGFVCVDRETNTITVTELGINSNCWNSRWACEHWRKRLKVSPKRYIVRKWSFTTNEPR